jgi:hypothetical protein
MQACGLRRSKLLSLLAVVGLRRAAADAGARSTFRRQRPASTHARSRSLSKAAHNHDMTTETAPLASARGSTPGSQGLPLRAHTRQALALAVSAASAGHDPSATPRTGSHTPRVVPRSTSTLLASKAGYHQRREEGWDGVRARQGVAAATIAALWAEAARSPINALMLGSGASASPDRSWLSPLRRPSSANTATRAARADAAPLWKPERVDDEITVPGDTTDTVTGDPRATATRAGHRSTMTDASDDNAHRSSTRNVVNSGAGGAAKFPQASSSGNPVRAVYSLRRMASAASATPRSPSPRASTHDHGYREARRASASGGISLQPSSSHSRDGVLVSDSVHSIGSTLTSASLNFRTVQRHATETLRNAMTVWRRALRMRHHDVRLPPALMRRDRHSTVSTRCLDLREWAAVVSDAAILRLQPCFRLLLTLHAPGCAGVSTRCWLALLSRSKHLTSVTISDSQSVTNEVVQKLALRCPGLTYLDVRCTAIGTPALNTLADCCEDSLQHLCVRGCSAIGEARCLSRFTRLRHVDMSECLGLSWSTLCGLSPSCPGLSYLALNGTLINDTELMNVLGGDPSEPHSTLGFDAGKLEYLGLRRCPAISTAGLSFVFRHAPSHMRSLDIGYVTRVSAFALSALGTYCNRVNVLTMPRCGLNDEHLRCLASGCRALASIDLSYNTAITNDGLFALASSCAALVSLALNGCVNVTDDGVGAVVAAACTPDQRRNLCFRVGAVATQSTCESSRGDSRVRGGHINGADWASRNHPQVRITHGCNRCGLGVT